MAGTPYSDINDLMMSQLSDYRLIDIYSQDVLNDTTNLDTYLLGFMILAIPEFSKCSQNLSLRDDTTRLFTETLTDANKKILSKLMVKEWLQKEVKDILQMRLHVQDIDFKTFAEANNLTAKQSMLTMFKEECSQLLIDNYYENNSWANWYAGNFSGL
jgi:hypothetical protein